MVLVFMGEQTGIGMISILKAKLMRISMMFVPVILCISPI